MRVAVIGSSHVAAIKSGWDEISADHPDQDVGFLAIGGHKFSAAVLDADMIFGLPEEMRRDTSIAKFSRGQLDLRNFDHVWHVGIWQAPLVAVNALIFDNDIDGFEGDSLRHRLSRAAFDAVIDDLTRRAVPSGAWRNWPAPQLWFSSAPHRNALILKQKRLQNRELRNHGPVWDTVDAALAVRMTEAGIRHIPQPADTLDAHRFTQAGYGTARKKAGTGDVDVQNMNAAFGRRMWAAFLEQATKKP